MNLWQNINGGNERLTKSFFEERSSGWMVVALAGFEPAIPVPRTGVLPLDHSAEKKRIGLVPHAGTPNHFPLLIVNSILVYPSHYSNGIFCDFLPLWTCLLYRPSPEVLALCRMIVFITIHYRSMSFMVRQI